MSLIKQKCQTHWFLLVWSNGQNTSRWTFLTLWQTAVDTVTEMNGLKADGSNFHQDFLIFLWAKTYDSYDAKLKLNSIHSGFNWINNDHINQGLKHLDAKFKESICLKQKLKQDFSIAPCGYIWFSTAVAVVTTPQYTQHKYSSYLQHTHISVSPWPIQPLVDIRHFE